MKRFALTAAAVATLCFGFAGTSQAQFRINLGNGIQFDSNKGVQFNPQGGKYKTLPYNPGGHHGGGHQNYPHPGHGHGHTDYFSGAHYVLRLSNDRFRGDYFERSGKCYYYDGHGAPQLITYGGYAHVDDLAVRLEYLTQQLLLDMHYNYQHNRGFRETYSETYELFELAKYIHDEEHHGHRSEIRRKLGGLDALFHHIEDDVRGWHRHHHRQIGTLGIIDKMERIETTIHHLMNDVGVEYTVGLEEPPVPAGNGLEFPPIP